MLTGLRAAQVVGRRCEDAVRAVAGAAAGGGIALRMRPLPPRSAGIRRVGGAGAGGFRQAHAVAGGTPAAPPVELTPRQGEVLALLAEGLPARAIAKRLWVSETTVRNHIRAIFLELGVHSQLAAVVKAARLGVIPPIGPAQSREPSGA